MYYEHVLRLVWHCAQEEIRNTSKTGHNKRERERDTQLRDRQSYRINTLAHARGHVNTCMSWRADTLFCGWKHFKSFFSLLWLEMTTGGGGADVGNCRMDACPSSCKKSQVFVQLLLSFSLSLSPFLAWWKRKVIWGKKERFNNHIRSLFEATEAI